MGSDQNQE